MLRDRASNQPVPPVPPFGKSLLCTNAAPQGKATFIPGCCAHAAAPWMSLLCGNTAGPLLPARCHPELGRRWSERPITCACMASACMERCHWAAPCWWLWQACDCNSRCSKPGIVPARLKLGVEDNKDPKKWVRGQRWRAELVKTGKLALRAGFDDKRGNSRKMCCCRSQLCSFLFFPNTASFK